MPRAPAAPTPSAGELLPKAPQVDSPQRSELTLRCLGSGSGTVDAGRVGDGSALASMAHVIEIEGVKGEGEGGRKGRDQRHRPNIRERQQTSSVPSLGL